MGSRGREDSRGRGGTETGRVWDERVRQSDHQQTPQPHIHAQINQDERWGAKQSAQPRAPAPGNKASNL